MRIRGLATNLLMVKIVTTGHISTWDHIKSVLSLSRKKQTRQKRFLYTQLRKTIHLPYPHERTCLTLGLERLVPIDPSKLQPSIFPRAKEVHVTAGTGVSMWSKVQGWFWELGERLAQPDLRYSIKVGLAGGESVPPIWVEGRSADSV